ncbi:hypothetical protein H2200_005894 [Cladophialophora chaetospira]|uniref:Phosphatidylethanolamine-binding protein n=1 Tax=Cladophialophora chaetospira TaxID=386627 RepID=A0AA39CIU4_9EURO|nr:hypothetical protein H2200_005894 [Cladophialophora chaetospira]
MKDLRSLVLLALAALINAQSAPDFPIQVDTTLRVDYQSSSISIKAGELINRNDVLDEPTIVGPSDSSRTVDYMVFIIDEDVTPPNDPSSRVQFLHWFEPNLAGASEVLFADVDAQNFTSATPLTYIPPSPPGGDKAHRYTVIMYNQPEGFSIPSAFTSVFQDKSDLSNRLNFDIKGFVDASGLGEPVAANWFEVQNTTQPAGGSGSSSSSSSSTSSSTSFSTTTSSLPTEVPTLSRTFTETEATSTSESSAEVETSTAPPAEASTSTAVVVASPTLATTTSSTPSTSASITPDAGNGAGLVDVRGSMRALIISLLFSIGVAGFWLL